MVVSPSVLSLLVNFQPASVATAYTANPTHFVEFTTSATAVIPSAAIGTSVTPNTTAWANSSYVQLIASTSNAIILTTVIVNSAHSTEYEIDIATGAAASEVVIGTVRGYKTSSTSAPIRLPFPIPIANIATSTRVSCRIRKGIAGATAWAVSIEYYNTGTLVGPVTTTTKAMSVYPSAAIGTSVTPNTTAWANSNYFQLIASTSNAIVIVGITVAQAVVVEYEIDIATGAAASEVVIATFRSNIRSSGGGPGFIKLVTPIDNIATSTRVSCRMRKSGISGADWFIALLYYAKPL